jgi:D-alanyl-D-alanine carboxypeptidase
MTRKARALGMTNTTFTNATGLPDRGNVTTARDIATLSAALLRAHPSYYAYFGQQAFKYDNRSYANHNRLLGKLTGLDGIKTGFTNDAGYTLAASALRNGQRLITVVLGEPTIAARNRDVTALLDAGFSVLERRRLGENTSVAFNLPTLNHPALRLANTGEMGSRNDPSVIRASVAAPQVAKKHTASKASRHKASAKPAPRTAKAGSQRSKVAAKGKSSAKTRSAAKAKSTASAKSAAKSKAAATSKSAAKSKNAKSDATAKAGDGKAAKTTKSTTAKSSSAKREREAAVESRRKPSKSGADKSTAKRES